MTVFDVDKYPSNLTAEIHHVILNFTDEDSPEPFRGFFVFTFLSDVPDDEPFVKVYENDLLTGKEIEIVETDPLYQVVVDAAAESKA